VEVAVNNARRRTGPAALTCRVCAAEFVGRPNRKTCSSECRRLWKLSCDRRWPKAGLRATGATELEQAERDRIAFHEAGHATAAFLLGGCITGPVSIAARKHWRGVAFCRARHYPLDDVDRVKILMPMALLPPRLRRSLEIDAIISLAGRAAEMIRPTRSVETGYVPSPRADADDRSAEFVAALTRRDEHLLSLGDSDDVSHPDDLEQARGFADRLAGDLAGLVLQVLTVETERLARTRRFRHLCGALADELLARTTLSAADVRRILKQQADQLERRPRMSRSRSSKPAPVRTVVAWQGLVAASSHIPIRRGDRLPSDHPMVRAYPENFVDGETPEAEWPNAYDRGCGITADAPSESGR
jgi:hypothetical protein